MSGYSEYSRAQLRKAFVEILRQIGYAETLMNGAGETAERIAKLDTIRRKTLKLMASIFKEG